jgi:hypothetical protein
LRRDESFSTVLAAPLQVEFASQYTPIRKGFPNEIKAAGSFRYPAFDFLGCRL